MNIIGAVDYLLFPVGKSKISISAITGDLSTKPP